MARNILDEHLDVIKELEKRKRDVDTRIMDLTDLSPENSYSLRPGNPDFKAKEFVTELYKCHLDLREVDIRLEVAEKINNFYFKEDE